MTGSNSYERGGQPRSVADPLAARYEAMVRKQRELNARQEAEDEAWRFEQKSKAPDWIKNQPPFIKPMKDAVQHGRVHGPYTKDAVKLPQFNASQRLWYGTPQWAKAGYVSSAGHAGAGTARLGGSDDAPANPARR